MTDWFSNRGQMIQVSCAVIAVFVALMVWLAVPPDRLLFLAPVVAPIVIGISIGWIGSLAVRNAVKRPAPTEAPKPPAPDNKPRLRYEIQNRTCALGARDQFKIGFATYVFVLHAIETRKQGRHDTLMCDLESVEGIGSSIGGPDTEKITSTRYWLPATTSSKKHGEALLHFDRPSGTDMEVILVTVDHINAHAKTIDYTVCVIGGIGLSFGA
jgi:hypothetical protein